MAARKAEVIITCDGAQAKQVLEGINRELQKAIKEREQLLNKQKQNGTLTQDEIKRDRELKKYIDSLTTAQQKSAQEMKKYADVMKDLAGSKTKDLKRALGEVKRALDNMSSRDPKRAQLEQDLKRIQKQIDANTVSLGKNKNAWGALGTTMKNLFAYAGIFAGFNMLKSKFEEVIKKNRELSDQLANIRKVSGLAMEDINRLANNLAKIDTRSTIQELNDLAYTGSKLGFGQYGTEGLESFVKSALKVQNALKEDMGADAMTALSKMVEVMGLIPKMGVEKAMDATGSAIFKLASTSTATGTNIVEFSKRLMGLANIAGITTDELLAFGSAADSMALMPEVAATAFNKLITAMQKQPNLIENALHIEQGTISDMYQAGKMADAMVLVFEKMREKGGMNALMHAGVFKDLGSDGARLVSVMATMANRVDILNQHMKTSREAFAEATAVEQEYAIQMETAEAYMERAANMWTKAFVNPEGVDLTKEFAKAWYDVSKSLTQTEANSKAIHVIMTSIFGIMKLIINLIPTLIAGFTAWGAVATIAALNKKIAETGSLVAALTRAVKGLSVAGWAGIIAGVAMAAYTLYSHLKDLNQSMNDGSAIMDNFSKDLGELNKKYDIAAEEALRYKKAIDGAATGTKEHQAAITNFNNKFGGYLKNLLTERSTALDVADAYKEVCKQLRNKIALQLREEDIEKTVKPLVQERADLGETYEDLVKESKYSQFNRDWLRGYVEDDERNDLFTTTGGQHATARDINVKLGLNLSQSDLNDIINQVMEGKQFYESGTFKAGLTTGFQWQRPAQYDEKRIAFAALKYIRKEEQVRNQTQKVYDKYGNEIDASVPQDNSQTPAPLDNAPDKEAIKAAKKAEAEHKQALRKELQDAKRDSDAIIGKIEEWYRLQETVVTGFAADGKWTQEQAEMMNRELEAAKNEALANARLAISGRDTQTWERTKQNIRLLMFDTGKWSQELFGEMMDVSMSAIRQNLSRIDQEGGQYGITTSSLKDGLDKNAAGNLRKVQEIRNKTAKEVEKALLQFNYFEQATKAYEDRLTQLGLLTETAEQAAQRLNQLKASEKTEEQLTRERSTARRQAGDQFRQTPGASYNVNPDDTESLRSWLQGFTGAQGAVGANGFEWQFSGWAEAFKDDFGKWLTDSETYKAQIQAFYLSLVDYDTQYYNAVRQHREQMNKEADTRWETSGMGRVFNSAEQEINLQGRQQKMLGQEQGTNFGEMAGFYNVENDPEIQMSLLRMAQYEAELEAFKQENEGKKLEGAALDAYQQELFEREQQRKQLEQEAEESLMQHINDHISKLEQWTQPIEQFGADVGDAMGKAVFASESMADGMRNALRSLVQSWGESTIQIVKQLMMQQLKQRLIGKTMVKEKKKTEGEMTDVTEEGEKTRFNVTSVLETGAANIAQQVGDKMLATKQTQDTAEMQAEGQKATGGVLAGIAEGAAKIIGMLGPFGAPLIAVITALLMGLLNTALSALTGGGSSGQNNANQANRKVKLAQGMLTYDQGNLQEVAGEGRSTSGRLPLGSAASLVEEPTGRKNLSTVVGDDGRVYRAREQQSLPSGVSIVSEPIATRVNGQQALVAERGPEIVIGRRTTRAIQMNRPDLLRDLMLIDRGITTRKVRTFDEGNLSDLASALQPADAEPQPQSQQQTLDQATIESLRMLPAAMRSFSQMMAAIQQRGIPAEVQMFDTGGKKGLRSQLKQADKMMSRYEGK